MAIAKACYVICDECGDPAAVSTEGAKVARQYARQQGYTTKPKNDRDLCSRCNKTAPEWMRRGEGGGLR